ncbi:MAG: protein-disulfide reductase DsbD domain-containing protein [Pseudomonadota bacterium]
MRRSDLKSQIWRFVSAFAVLLTISFAIATGARAAETEWQDFDHSSVRLITASDTAGDGSFVRAGLHFKLPDNWKVYWRTAGEAGFPPSFDIENAPDIDRIAIEYPAPVRFNILGIESAGYKNEVVYPLKIFRKDPAAPLKINVAVNYLVCDEICVPNLVDLKLDLPAGRNAPSSQAHLINQYAGKSPVAVEQSPAATVLLWQDGKDGVLQVSLASPQFDGTNELFVEGKDFPWFWKPDIRPSATGAGVTVVARAPDTQVADFDAKPFTFTVLGGGQALQFSSMPEIVGAPPAEAGVSLVVILGFAFIGGFILNFMPCVLPVLSMKLMTVLSHQGEERSVTRLNFLASAAGVIAAFLVLAAGLAGLKAAGASIGWGIQFQQPVFLVFMSLVLVLFAANMFGFFEIVLPSGLATRFSSIGHGSSPGSHFATGAFATLLATPCSAPFLGTAVSFALSRTTADIFLVFAVLGIGLALPYLLIAAFPGIVRYLPKPGNWMNWLRRILSLALLATAIWLMSILWAQTGALVAGVVLAALILLFALPAFSGRLKGASVPAIIAIAALALIFTGFAERSSLARSGNEIDDRIVWQKFDPTLIAGLVADNKIVFVDITADWCLTCIFNKRSVLSREEIQALFERQDVVAMKGDWTNPDPVISAYLAENGRYGIPFNAVYSPKTPKGTALPELLTVKAVKSAMAR